MRNRIMLAIPILVLMVVFSPTTRTSATPTDCDVVNQVCNDMAPMIYNACIVNGGSPTSCAADEANYRISCKANNGCPLPKTGDY